MFKLLKEDLSNIFGKTDISKEEKNIDKKYGEGYSAENVYGISIGAVNQFQRYLYHAIKSEVQKIKVYREMATYPEIGDVLEEICDEGTKEDSQGSIININFTSEKFEKNKRARENIIKEFNEFFYKQIEIQYLIWDFFWTFLVDARLYIENIVDEKNPSNGIIALKKLPSTTMDFDYDAYTNKIVRYRQRIGRIKGSKTNLIEFDPAQITFLDYGLYGANRKSIYGYLEKAKIPYRQLRLLEDSAIIYRIVRAPERFVFNVDTGNMPRHKAEEYVNRLKNQYKRKMSYNPSTGTLSSSSNVLSTLENFWLPKSADGRGSTVEVLQGGCLSLNTKVPLLDGRVEELSNLIKEHNSGKQNWVYSCNPKTGEVVPGKISWAGVTRKKTEVLKLTLDNGKEIICTPDHKFPTWNKGKVEAKNLKINDSIISFNINEEKIGDNRNKYKIIFDHKTKKWKFVHRMVVESLKNKNIIKSFEYCEKYSNEPKYVVHHKDFNRYNNNPENLVLMGWKDHQTDVFQEQHLLKLLKGFNYENWRDFGDKVSLFNHKIVKITYLEEKMDVGTLTIDADEQYHNYHTFALEAGVFTFNSTLGEIQDIIYFLKKLYKALKYPISRVIGEGESTWLTEGRASAEITRDEVKFAKFIERIQNKFSLAFERLFLIHIQLKGTFKNYDISKNDFSIEFNPPSSYKEVKELEMEDLRGGVYSSLRGDDTISHTFLKKKYLHWSPEDLKQNIDSLKEDITIEKEINDFKAKLQPSEQTSEMGRERPESFPGIPIGGKEEGGEEEKGEEEEEI